MLSSLVRPILLVFTLATALFLSRAVLDRLVTGGGAVRVALFPPWPAWVGFAALAAVAWWWLSRAGSRRVATTAATRVPLAAVLTPGFALALLALPYVPWLPDELPVLQILAGPLRLVLWLVIVAQIGWVYWQHRPPRLAFVERWSIDRVTLAVGLATAIVCGVAAGRLTSSVLFPAGDEPHYLIIAQSLWRDGDLKIENNHQRADYVEYYTRELEPHYLTRGKDGEIYSVHPIGLPMLLAPVYAVGGYRFVVLTLIAFAAAATAWMWRFVTLTSNSAGAATFACAAIVGSAPLLLNTFAVYPEVAAALAVVVAMTMALSMTPESRDVSRALMVGTAAAALPWLSTKYAPMSAALVSVALARVWIAWPHRLAKPVAGATLSLGILAPYLLSLAAWFAFFYAYWGIPLPQAPYGALVQTDVKNLIFGAPGLIFDQEYGLFAYAPVYVLAATGLVAMWRLGGDWRRRGVEIALVFGALVGTVGAFRIWWGGTASPGRPLASGLLLLALPMAMAFRAARPGSTLRAAHHLLLWVGVGLAATIIFAQEGLLINNGRDGSSSLLGYLSPLWEVWTLAPTFTHHEAGRAILHSLAWLAVAWAAAALMRRHRPATPGEASLAAIATLSASLVLIAIVMPLLAADSSQPVVDPRARARSVALDRFDRVALPTAVVYDPWRWLPAQDVLPLLTLGVAPGLRPDPQPVRVLHNGRFSLPAGQYRVSVRWDQRNPLPASAPTDLALQIGRIGPQLETWRVEPTPGGLWEHGFTLPVDTAFVGFRGSLELERSIANLTVTPVDVVDEGTRPRSPPVLAAWRYADALVLFHDERTFPEPTGFWTIGARRTIFTLSLETPPEVPAVVRMHPGARPNHVVLWGYGWRQALDLEPGSHATVPLPDPTRRVVQIGVDTAGGFVPSEVDPSSQDHRRLGAWVEIGR
jgi:hypothetical protein